MQQPYPLPTGATMDFRFDFSDLNALGDSIASYVTSASGMTVVSSAEAAGFVTVLVRWINASVGDSGTVNCTVTTDDARVIPAQMTFLATAYAP